MLAIFSPEEGLPDDGGATLRREMLPTGYPRRLREIDRRRAPTMEIYRQEEG
jgi:hypothetical protein